MSNILIASSNVYRYYKPGMVDGVRDYTVLKCTQSEIFNAAMTNLGENDKFVLISVIENFVSDAVGADSDSPDSAIASCITEVMKVVRETAERLPNSKFGFTMPLERPALPWYQEKKEKITIMVDKFLKTISRESKIGNVSKVDCSPILSQQFEPDMVHLTPAAAKVFLEIMLESAEALFSAEEVNLDDVSDEGEVLDDELTLEQRVGHLERKAGLQDKKNIGNDLVFARIREEINSNGNKAKEDRVVINGLKSKTPMPTETRARIDHLRKIAGEIFETLIPGFKGEIVYLTQGKNAASQHIPMIEVKMNSAENAHEVRKAFADKRKKKLLPDDMKDLFIANSVNLATRIQIDILKAIAKKISNAKETAYVSGFVSRPMMHIRKGGPPSGGKPIRSFTFVDAVAKYRRKITDSDLGAAYNRAGSAFAGQLKQNFILLNEQDSRLFEPAFDGPSASYGSSRSTGGSGTGSRGGSASWRSRGGARAGARSGSTSRPYRKGKKRSGDDLQSSATKK